MHEASLHEANCFVTLTYSDEHLPEDSGLRYRDYQLFMKRLRKHYPRARFFACGEYGDRFKRPHYHAALFGVSFPDATPAARSPSGALLQSSALLTSLWKLGHASIGDLTEQSAAYMARYVLKKQSKGPLLNQNYHYTRVDPDTGEVFDVSPEFVRMSLKPGIGKRWIEKYHQDVYPIDAINNHGRLSKPPRYYDKHLEQLDHELLAQIQASRYRKAISHSSEATAARLKTREQVHLARIKQLKRNLE